MYIDHVPNTVQVLIDPYYETNCDRESNPERSSPHSTKDGVHLSESATEHPCV